jgi:predicted nucleic acid-binding protein
VIVIDASAVIELLLQTERGTRVGHRLAGEDEDLHAPHLLDLEVLSTLRRLVRGREVAVARAEQALEDLALLRIIRHDHLVFLTRIWALRDNLTAYDAAYVALAESMDATLLTCDRALIAAAGRLVRVDVAGPG